MLGRTETRTRDRIFCQTMRTVRDISRDDRARIATCSLRTLANYSIEYKFLGSDAGRSLSQQTPFQYNGDHICIMGFNVVLYWCLARTMTGLHV